MAKRKRPRDINELAKFIVDLATGDEQEPNVNGHKNIAAVTMGKKGGDKGGVARAEKLTPEQRREIAQKAARARWSK